MKDVEEERRSFEKKYGGSPLERWAFHDTPDPLIRYLRDRRLKIGLDRAIELVGRPASELRALVVCGGVGGEGTYLRKYGFRSVTVSDFSVGALEVCRKRDPALGLCVLNGEALGLKNESYDVVLVQDGLHHLPRPALGYTEMLRVAKHAVVVIEPHLGLAGRLLGREWEDHDGSVNYVFRWDRWMVTQITKSYFVQRPLHIEPIRVWDHNEVMGKFAKKLGGGKLGLLWVKTAYFFMNLLFWWLGNMMIAVVVKPPAKEAPPP
jgi:ubiquinone/menaquinone biosynthesis C-methylase UbiE